MMTKKKENLDISGLQETVKMNDGQIDFNSMLTRLGLFLSSVGHIYCTFSRSHISKVSKVGDRGRG